MQKKNLIIIIISIILVLIICLVTGILIYNNTQTKTRYNEFEQAVTKYYDQHMSNLIGIDKAEITLKMLDNAIDKNLDKYEIKSLKKCNRDSKAILTIEKQKVKNVEISLTCK